MRCSQVEFFFEFDLRAQVSIEPTSVKINQVHMISTTQYAWYLKSNSSEHLFLI